MFKSELPQHSNFIFLETIKYFVNDFCLRFSWENTFWDALFLFFSKFLFWADFMSQLGCIIINLQHTDPSLLCLYRKYKLFFGISKNKNRIWGRSLKWTRVSNVWSWNFKNYYSNHNTLTAIFVVCSSIFFFFTFS